MLPPVPATSVALAMQANQRQASTQQVAPDASAEDGTAPATARTIVPGSTSSLELLGLSGQMRLSQSLSVFAETLGSLLKLPRREGEALADYSKKLAAAITALGAEERTRLQTQLNTIMQGATLRLLAELLKDPSGPAAARLAVQIEMAQYQERDLAARHVVSSYRQNNGGDLSPLAPGGRANGNATEGQPPSLAATVEGESTEPVTSFRNASNTEAPSPASKTNVMTAITAIEDDPISVQSGEAVVSTVDKPAQAATGTHDHDSADSQIAGRAAGRTDSKVIYAGGSHTTDRTADASEEQAAGTDQRPSQSQTPNSSLASSAAIASPPPARAGETAAKPTAIYDAAALARQAHDETDLPSPATRPIIAKATIDRFQAEWVAELGGEPDVQVKKQIALAQASIMTLQAGEEADPTSTTGTENVQPQTRSPDPLEGETSEPLVNALPLATNTAPTSANISAQPDTAFEKALLGMSLLPRDVPAHPLVPHAGTQDFEERENHEIKRKPSVGDDGQPPRREHPGQEQGGSEQQNDGGKQQPQPVSPEDEILHSAVADSVLTTAGIKQAPRQHLTDHPAPGAEDFYRRLAVLE